MKALSLIQPYATAIMLGHKKIETRSWRTNHTGRIAIHASKAMPQWAKNFAATEVSLGRIPSRIPLGAIIGFATIMGMRQTEDLALQISAVERLYGDYSPGRWGWMLCDIEPLPSDRIIPCRGALGLWDVPADVLSTLPHGK